MCTWDDVHKVVKVMLIDWRPVLLDLCDYTNGSRDGLVLTLTNNVILAIKPPGSWHLVTSKLVP